MRVWLMGNVYDFEKNTLKEIRRDMVDFLAKRNLKISVGIKKLTDNAVKIILVRNTKIDDEHFNLDYICEEDQALIDGRWYRNFTPHFCIKNLDIRNPFQSHWNRVEDFISVYKKNTIYYGANPVDLMYLECDPDKIIIKIKTK